MTTQRFNERLQQRRRVTDPLRKQRAIKLDAFSRVYDRLPVKRHVVCELRDQHVRQQPRTGDTAFDGAARCRRLRDVIATHAGKLRAHMTDDPEAGRYVLKLFGDVFAQRLHHATALRALRGGFGHMRLDLARQMFGQWLARCLFHSRARRLWDFDRCSAFVGLKLFETQLELLDLTIPLLRLATELHTAQLGDEQLQVFDFGCARSQRGLLRVDCFLQFEHLRVALAKRRLLAEQHGLQRFDIVGK